jgi:hypothetical protein
LVILLLSASTNFRDTTDNGCSSSALVSRVCGQRNFGQRLLELAVKGFEDFSQARGALKKTVETIVE